MSRRSGGREHKLDKPSATTTKGIQAFFTSVNTPASVDAPSRVKQAVGKDSRSGLPLPCCDCQYCSLNPAGLSIFELDIHMYDLIRSYKFQGHESSVA